MHVIFWRCLLWYLRVSGIEWIVSFLFRCYFIASLVPFIQTILVFCKHILIKARRLLLLCLFWNFFANQISLRILKKNLVVHGWYWPFLVQRIVLPLYSIPTTSDLLMLYLLGIRLIEFWFKINFLIDS